MGMLAENATKKRVTPAGDPRRAVLGADPPVRPGAGRGGATQLGDTLWEVGITHLKDGPCTPAVPEDYDAAILRTSIPKYSPTGLTGAPRSPSGAR